VTRNALMSQVGEALGEVEIVRAVAGDNLEGTSANQLYGSYLCSVNGAV
jgi:hypothetical protein